MQTKGTTYLTSNEFNDAMLTAKPGETVIYATGDVGYSKVGCEELKQVARLAMNMQSSGAAFLTQRRRADLKFLIGGASFEYRATKRLLPSPTA